MSPKKDKHDVIRHLQGKGKSLSSIALDAGFSESLCRLAFLRPQISGEAIIVAATGFKPHHIWPDRYDKHGNRTVPKSKNTRRMSSRKRQRSDKSLTPVCSNANDCLGEAS